MLALASAPPACAAPAAPSPPAPRWWQTFADPALDDLMARIEQDNTILADAVARLAMARANARLGQAGSAPQLGLASSANYAAGPLINAAGGSGSLFTGTIAATWEPDLLGRLAPTHRADKAEIRAAESDLAAARLLVQVTTARAWYASTALAQARVSATQALDLASDAEARTRRCLASGSCTAGQVAQGARQRSEAADRLALVERRETETRDTLAYLLGSRTVIASAPSALPQGPAVPAGLDSGIVARRPDVAAAEARLDAATERQTAARRDWLPRFGLTAAGGSASATLTGLLAGGAGSIGLGLLVALPVLDGGRHKARVAASNAASNLAAVRLRDTLLVAYRETNDALAGTMQAAAAVREARQRSIDAQSQASRIRRASLRGSASSLEVASARMAEIEASRSLALAQLDQLDASLRLVLAIGGGW